MRVPDPADMTAPGRDIALADDEVHDVSTLNERAMGLRDAVLGLPLAERQVLLLSRLANRSYEQIAGIRGGLANDAERLLAKALLLLVSRTCGTKSKLVALQKPVR